MGQATAFEATMGSAAEADPAGMSSADIRRDLLAGLAGKVAPGVLAGGRRLPVLPPLATLLPGGGLRRGSSASVDGVAATSLALALAAGPSQDGAWVAAVGFPSLGLAAAAELGVALDRLVLVSAPTWSGSTGEQEPSDVDVWSAVVATLVDAFEVVLVHADHRVSGRDARRLAARCRERDAVLVRVGSSGPTSAQWPEAPDVGLRVVRTQWEGLGAGHGHLRARRVVVEATGRREASKPRRAELWLPSVDGTVEVVPAAPVPIRSGPVLLPPRRAEAVS